MTIIAIGFYGPKVSELNKAFKNIEKKQAVSYFVVVFVVVVSVLKSLC